MKSKHLLLMLLLALFVPWAAMAQSTLTVHELQTQNTNSNVPFWGTWADNSLKCEMVYPATELGDMENGTITNLHFYTNGTENVPTTSGTDHWDGTFQIFMKEVSGTTITAFSGITDATIVYEGQIPLVNGEMTIEFTTPYNYNGGNLLLGVYYTTGGHYFTVYWEGENVTGASIYGRSGQSYNVQAGGFLPKTTFTYTPATPATTPPSVTTSDAVANLTNTSVTLGGTLTDLGDGSGASAGICYSTTATPTTSDGHVQSYYTTTGPITKDITGLLPGTTYYYRAYAYNTANSLADPTYGDIYSFTTAGNITLTQPANGEISASVAGGTPTTSSTYALPGESVTLTATPASGYDLDCWTVTGVTGTATGNTYTFTMPSNNVTATANIVPTSGGTSSESYYQLATTVESGAKYLIVRGSSSTISGSTSFFAMERNNTTSTSGTLDYGTPIFKDSEKQKITGITPRTSGHPFSDFVWTITASGSDYTISAENGGSTYYLIETTASDGSLYSYTTSNSGYDENKTKWTVYTSTNDAFLIHNSYWYSQYSTPGGRYYYLYYSGGFKNYYSSTTPANITSASYRMYLYKETSATTYAITATASPAEGGTVAGSDYYASGATCTLTATPAFGYEFVSWTEGGTVVSTNEEYTFTVSSARTLVANFETQGSCIKPTDLAQVGTQAAHQAQLSWTENSEATQWQVVYSTDSEFNPDDATPIDVNENPATITGLSQSTTYYARVRAICGQNSQSGWSSQAPLITISGHQAPTTVSYDPATLTADEVTVSWTGVATNVLHQSYDLYYSTDPVMPAILDQNTLIVGLTGNSHHLTGLTSETLNYVWVRDNCGDDGYSDWSTPVSFEPTAKITIGSGTGTNSYLPAQCNYDYSYTQQIYTVAELGTAGVIESIDFYMTGTSNYTYYVDVYMVSTDKSNFTGTSDWIAVTDADLVFGGNVEFNGNAWTTITLADGFIYDGTQNVAIIVDGHKATSWSTKSFRSFTVETIQSHYGYQDTNDINPSNPGTPSNNNTTTTKNQIRILKSELSNCMKPTGLTAGTPGARSVELSWTENGESTAWVISYNGSTANANTNPFTLTGLTPETTYTVKVRPECDENLWSSEISFTTEVACPAPTNVTASNVTNNSAEISWEGDANGYNIQYREYASPTGTLYDFESGMGGWTTIDADGDGYNWVLGSQAEVYLYEGTLSGYGYNGSSDLIVSGSYRNTSSTGGEELTPDNYLVSPLITLGGTISFYAHGSNLSYVEEHFGVFVSTNSNDDPNDFVMVNEWTATTEDYIQYSADLSAYSGQGYVAIRHFNCTNMFLLSVDNITITNPAATEQPWTLIEDVTNPQSIPGLTAETTYEVQVQAVCGGEDGESVWTSLAEPFTTLSNCSAPGELNVTDLTANSATLNWIGAQDTYNVRYSKLVAGPEVTTTEDFSGQDIAAYSSTGELPDGWHSYTTQSYTPHVCNSSSYTYINNLDGNYLLMTTNNSNTASVYAIMPKYDNLTAVSFYYVFESTSSCGTLEVGYVTDNTGYGTFQRLGDAIAPATTWSSNPYTLSSSDISTINSVGGYVAFKYNSNSTTYYSAAIDNITVTTQSVTASEWNETNTNVTSPLPISGLEMNTTYQWQVQGINASCDGGLTAWSDMGSFITPYPTFTKTINAFDTENEKGWYLIASPLVGAIDPTTMTNLITDNADDFALYRFNQSATLEWENWKAEDNYHFNLESGKGYLYGNKNGGSITFTGVPYSGDGAVTLSKTDGAVWAGWNLVGNPFPELAYLPNGMEYYTLDDTGSELTAAEGNSVEAMEGIFVIAGEDGETLTFSTTNPNSGKGASLSLNVTRNRGSVIDRAIVRFGESSTLPKFQLNPNHTKVYIPQYGKDYAVVKAESQGAMPVNFKAEENGTYTLSFNAEEVSFNYLHLIDNMTGNDVDLLQNPSYSFNATTTDYESRFKLVFCTGDNSNDDSFAFFSNGNWIINNDGEATLQVIDVNGRILSSETVSGSVSKAINATPGVYMIRLINGDNVKVQKIVVR